jgi:lipopolysaccharide transport system ATP-binding protein
MTTAIKVENLSKAYQLGTIGTGTISRDIHRWWTTKILGNEDPFLKIGETNDRSTKGTSDIVWSLKDINFEIEQGDAVGIIGKNGAGKSTLLKLLSRVTATTTGSVKVKGRVASLLEVGTGFHPELTGRENIYLNGAILGMRKKEITRKLDEIIDFSGVERYIDTPVKRYSSGMYVRLAFAVAAHLESEILIVDEVLAVGDAEFQKKCLGKMGEVSKGEGRTVLFVSHNMAAVKNLCSNGIILNNGQILAEGYIDKIVNVYLNNTFSQGDSNHNLANITERSGLGAIRITSLTVKNADTDSDVIVSNCNSTFTLCYDASIISDNIRIILGIYNNQEDSILRFDSSISNNNRLSISSKKGKLICDTNPFFLTPGKYYVNIALYSDNILQDYLQGKCSFEVQDSDFFKTGKMFEKNLTKILTPHKWKILLN